MRRKNKIKKESNCKSFCVARKSNKDNQKAFWFMRKLYFYCDSKIKISKYFQKFSKAYSFVFLYFHFLRNILSQRIKLYRSFFFLGYLSPTSTIHRTEKEGEDYFFNFSVQLPPSLRTHRHQQCNYSRDPTSSHGQEPDSNQKPLAFKHKTLTHVSTLL